MRRYLYSLALLGFVLGLPTERGSADELVPCLNDGIELRQDFIISLRHEGKPLPGVKVEITRGRPAFNAEIVESSLTGTDGRVRITALRPGQYWLSAEMLGISAAYHCFHVSDETSRRAKRFAAYEWGYGAPVVRRVLGELVDTEPGSGGSPLWNLSHPVDVPISGAALRLTNARTRQAFSTTSDDRGEFAFGQLTDGTYVLHSEGGKTGRSYKPTDLLVKISSGAKTSRVILKRNNPSASSGASMSFFWAGSERPKFR